MAREIERKFRVCGDGWRALCGDTRHIVQFYLAMTDRAQVRVRIVDDASAVMTVKSAAATIDRQEHELVIPVADARQMMTLRVGCMIEKTRHRIAGSDGRIWEIDEFGGAHQGLVLAEIEMENSADEPALFDWIGAEVTGDPAYYNAALAMAGGAEA